MVAAMAESMDTIAAVATARRIAKSVRRLRIAPRMILSAVDSSMSKMWLGMFIGMGTPFHCVLAAAQIAATLSRMSSAYLPYTFRCSSFIGGSSPLRKGVIIN